MVKLTDPLSQVLDDADVREAERFSPLDVDPLRFDQAGLSVKAKLARRDKRRRKK